MSKVIPKVTAEGMPNPAAPYSKNLLYKRGYYYRTKRKLRWEKSCVQIVVSLKTQNLICAMELSSYIDHAVSRKLYECNRVIQPLHFRRFVLSVRDNWVRNKGESWNMNVNTARPVKKHDILRKTSSINLDRALKMLLGCDSSDDEYHDILKTLLIDCCDDSQKIQIHRSMSNADTGTEYDHLHENQYGEVFQKDDYVDDRHLFVGNGKNEPITPLYLFSAMGDDRYTNMEIAFQYDVIGSELLSWFSGDHDLPSNDSGAKRNQAPTNFIVDGNHMIATKTNIFIAHNDVIDDVRLSNSELQERYWHELKRSKSMKAENLKSHQRYLKLFFDFLSTRHIASVTKRDLGEYQNALYHYPKNANKGNMSSLSFEEKVALKLPTDKCVSVTTINDNYLSRLKNFLKWCHNGGHIDADLAASIQIKTKRSSDDRLPMPQKFIEFMLQPIVRTKVFENVEEVWFFVLAVYTGARLNEILQFECKDFDMQNHILTMSSNLKGEGGQKKKTYKTSHSQRSLPIHPDLIKLGLYDFVDSKKTHSLLFQVFYDVKSKPSSAFSKRAARRIASFTKLYDGNLGAEEKQFHCLRHAFSQKLKDAGVDSHHIKYLMGHKDTSMYAHYGQGSALAEDKVSAYSKADFKLDIDKVCALLNTFA